MPTPEFKTVLREFAQDIKRNFRSRIAAQPEDQLKPGVQQVLRAAAPKIETRTEAHSADVEGRPDIGVASTRLLCGFVELKAPGKGARPQRFTGADKKQWEKFKPHPVDCLFQLAAHRPPQCGATGGKARATLSSGSRRCPACRGSRKFKSGATLQGISQYLFPDASAFKFADAYAQTLTYAPLLARLNGETKLTTDSAARALDSGHGFPRLIRRQRCHSALPQPTADERKPPSEEEETTSQQGLAL